MPDRTVTITDRDVEFVRLAKAHYKLFAEVSERQARDGVEGTARTAGIMRAQEFYAERFLTRMEADHG